MSGRGATVRIGLTGPIGCGKSTVAAWLAELGAVVIDADQEARDATAPGSAAAEAVAGAFGHGVVRGDGTLDRAALAQIVFGDPAALARLEAIIHPAVRPRIIRKIAAAERRSAPAVVVEAIKLVEGGLAVLCDEVWLIACGPEAQRARLAGRGASPADAEARIAVTVGDHRPPAGARNPSHRHGWRGLPTRGASFAGRTQPPSRERRAASSRA